MLGLWLYTTINNTHLASYDPYAAVIKISFTTQAIQESENEKLRISKCLFAGNLGTPLAIVAENFALPLTFDSNMIFINNKAILGGGMYVKNMLADPLQQLQTFHLWTMKPFMVVH